MKAGQLMVDFRYSPKHKESFLLLFWNIGKDFDYALSPNSQVKFTTGTKVSSR